MHEEMQAKMQATLLLDRGAMQENAAQLGWGKKGINTSSLRTRECRNWYTSINGLPALFVGIFFLFTFHLLPPPRFPLPCPSILIQAINQKYIMFDVFTFIFMHTVAINEKIEVLSMKRCHHQS